MEPAYNIDSWSGQVLTKEGPKFLHSFVKQYLLLIRYMVCYQILKGKVRIFFYNPQNNQYWIKGRLCPDFLENADWTKARITKIYMI